MTDKPKKPTVKQTNFVKEYVKNGGNGIQAALAAYDINKDDPDKAINTANVIAVENLQKPTIKQAIEKAMVKHGITMDAAVAPIADGLQASKYIPDGQGGAIDVPDHTSRLKASGMALKLLGADKEAGKGGNIFNFINSNASFNSGKYKD